MEEQKPAQPREQKPIGGDFVLPVMGLVFTLYYFTTIWDYPWEAKINGFLMGSILLLLVTIFFVRSWLRLRGGTASMGFGSLLRPANLLYRRLGLLGLSIAFIVVIEWLGFSLSMFGFLLCALRLLGVKDPKRLWGIPTVLTVGGYVLFIALLDSRFPHGPVENFLELIF